MLSRKWGTASVFFGPLLCSYYKLHKNGQAGSLSISVPSLVVGLFRGWESGCLGPTYEEVPIKAMPPPARAVDVGSGSCSSWDPQISGLIPAWEKSLLLLATSAFLFSGIFPAISLSLHTCKKTKKIFFQSF